MGVVFMATFEVFGKEVSIRDCIVEKFKALEHGLPFEDGTARYLVSSKDERKDLAAVELADTIESNIRSHVQVYKTLEERIPEMESISQVPMEARGKGRIVVCKLKPFMHIVAYANKSLEGKDALFFYDSVDRTLSTRIPLELLSAFENKDIRDHAKQLVENLKRSVCLEKAKEDNEHEM